MSATETVSRSAFRSRDTDPQGRGDLPAQELGLHTISTHLTRLLHTLLVRSQDMECLGRALSGLWAGSMSPLSPDSGVQGNRTHDHIRRVLERHLFSELPTEETTDRPVSPH